MWKQRLVRLLLVGLGALLVLGLVKTLADWRAKNPSASQLFKLPKLSFENIKPENVLGTATRGIFGKKEKQTDQQKQANQEEQETEPITEPVEKVQTQTQQLIESIKKLPEDQIKAIKKQIFKEFCEDYCQKCEEE